MAFLNYTISCILSWQMLCVKGGHLQGGDFMHVSVHCMTEDEIIFRKCGVGERNARGFFDAICVRRRPVDCKPAYGLFVGAWQLDMLQVLWWCSSTNWFHTCWQKVSIWQGMVMVWFCGWPWFGSSLCSLHPAFAVFKTLTPQKKMQSLKGWKPFVGDHMEPLQFHDWIRCRFRAGPVTSFRQFSDN